MKHLLLFVPCCVALASCTTFSTAPQLSDYNGDGFVSDAEYKQYQKQRNIEDRAVYTESVKRRNVTNSVRDASQAVWGVHSLLNGIRAF